MKCFLKYSLLFIVAWLSLSFQQPPFDPNAKVKAVFLYNFTKYFQWPESMKNGSFVIHVVGTNASLSQELNKMALSKQVGNQKLEIKTTPSVEGLGQAHIIFLLSESSDRLKDILSRYKGKGALIVTEKAGLAKAGAAINFVVSENKQRFEYNENSAIKAGLKTGEGLSNLAIVVIK